MIAPSITAFLLLNRLRCKDVHHPGSVLNFSWLHHARVFLVDIDLQEPCRRGRVVKGSTVYSLYPQGGPKSGEEDASGAMSSSVARNMKLPVAFESREVDNSQWHRPGTLMRNGCRAGDQLHGRLFACTFKRIRPSRSHRLQRRTNRSRFAWIPGVGTGNNTARISSYLVKQASDNAGC